MTTKDTGGPAYSRVGINYADYEYNNSKSCSARAKADSDLTGDSGAAAEAGNVLFSEPEIEPMTPTDCIALGAIVLASILIACGIAGWIYQRL